MKRFLILCLVTVLGACICHADEVVLAPDLELEEVACGNACPCSKSCRCPETCRCRETGCRGCCDQYKTKADGACAAAYCDCAQDCRCS